MIKLQVKPLLAERERSLYWLMKQTGIRYATLLKMRAGETTRIDLPALEALCRALEVEPGELLVLQPKLKKRAATARKR
jgi:DNA-binding Xre family transcriptional regulator